MGFIPEDSDREGYIENILPLEDVRADLRQNILEYLLLLVYLGFIGANDPTTSIGSLLAGRHLPVREQEMLLGFLLCAGLWGEDEGFVLLFLKLSRLTIDRGVLFGV